MEGSSDRVTLVTGAAGGIGAAVSRRLAEDGMSVAMLDRAGGALTEASAKLVADGLAATAFAVDVTRASEVNDVVRAVESRLGPIENLVHSAGLLRLAEVSELTDEDWSQMFAVNCTGVFLMSRAVVRSMIARRSGSIVTVASNSGGTARMGMAGYGASKAAASQFTKSLGLEVAEYGIRCNVVAPGSTDTPMLHAMWPDDGGRHRTIEGDLRTFKTGIPLGKLARPSDIADSVAFLLSDQASHITMHELTVDGGATLGA